MVFDLDGTLTRTNAEDDAAFLHGFAAIGIRDVEPEWSRYVNQTDGGLLEEVFAAARGRPPSDDDVRTFRAAFLGRLETSMGVAGSSDLATPGAAGLLATLGARADWRAAIATGSWEASARIKLSAAGLPPDLPMGTGDDAVARSEILATAIRRAAPPEGTAVVYVGDRPWDGRAAAALAVGFVAVAGATPPDLLRDAGAFDVLEDLNPERALPALAAAARPLPATSRRSHRR